MHRLGIVGGIAPESTVDYYRRIMALYQQRRPDGHNPELIINSIDLRRMLDLVAAGDRRALADYLSGEIARVARAGATIGLLASNTPHLVFDDLSAPRRFRSSASWRRRARKWRSAVSRGSRCWARASRWRAGSIQTSWRNAASRSSCRRRPSAPTCTSQYLGELVAGVYRSETRDGGARRSSSECDRTRGLRRSSWAGPSCRCSSETARRLPSRSSIRRASTSRRPLRRSCRSVTVSVR